jgi:VWFA-related protein
LLLGLPTLALAALAGPARAQGHLRLAQPDASHFPEIRLFAYPTGTDRRVIENLSPARFRVTEDGQPAPVLAVQGGGAGSVAVCLALDRSGSMDSLAGPGVRKLELAQEAARAFLNALRPGDRAAVLSFAGEVSRDQPLTDNRQHLLAAINHPEAYGKTALYDAIYWSIQQVALGRRRGSMVAVDRSLSEARRAVLVLTDGHDDGSSVFPERILQEARANGVTVYTIGLGQDLSGAILSQLAAETGGEYFAAPRAEQLDEIYQRMARRLRDEYRLTFRSPRPQADGRRREVSVTVLGTTLPPARGWYQAPGRGSMVVTVARPAGGGQLTGTAPGADPARGWGAVLLGMGVLGVAAGAALLFAFRHRIHLAAGPGSPALDYGPLWAHGPVTRIGRDGTNHVVVESARVSRQHALLEARDGGYYLTDLASANGTRLNGRPVGRAQLHPGDQVEFGNARFTFIGEPTTGAASGGADAAGIRPDAGG